MHVVHINNIRFFIEQMSYIRFYCEWFIQIIITFIFYIFKKLLKSTKGVISNKSKQEGAIEKKYEMINLYTFMNRGEFNNFTFANDKKSIPYLSKVSGTTSYRGRVGLGIYPKELLLFKIIAHYVCKKNIQKK